MRSAGSRGGEACAFGVEPTGAAGCTPFYAPPEDTAVTALEEGAALAHLETGFADGTQQAVETSVRAYLDQCAATAVANPTDCPFQRWLVWGDNPATTWRIGEYPVLDLAPRQDGLISVGSSSSGRADWAADGESNSEAFQVQGAVAWDGKPTSQAVFSPR